MPEIKIDENEILKLLSNLKVDKVAGPDDIKPIVLKELRKEIAPVMLSLRSHLKQANCQKIGQQQEFVLFSKGAINVIPQTTGQYP